MKTESKSRFTCSRREMLRVAGLGAVAMAIPGLSGRAEAASVIDEKETVVETGVLVVGGASAGTSAAVKAKEQGVDVALAISGSGAGKKVRDMGIQLLERVRVSDLLLDGNRATGAVFHVSKEDRTITIKARSVIFATEAGGYKPNGLPLSALTFDRKAMVYKHGMPLSAPMAMTSKEKRTDGTEKG